MNIRDVRELLHVPISALRWAVYGVVSKIEKERLSLVPLDEVAGFVSQRISEVCLFIDRRAAAEQWIVGIVFGVRSNQGECSR